MLPLMVSMTATAAEPWIVSTESQKKIKNPVSKSQVSAAALRGKVVYDKECASCHGEAGKGDGPDGLYFKVRPSDLTAKAIRSQSAEVLFVKVTSGRTDMPGFENSLTEPARWDVVHYIQTLQ